MSTLKIILLTILITFIGLPVYAGIPEGNQRVFNIYRSGKKIGTHTLTFTQQGLDTIVDINIKMKVTLGFVPLYKYQHTNREVWRGDQLLSLDALTNNNGKKVFVRAYKDGNVLNVTSNDYTYTAPASTMSTSYWHRATAYQKQLINTQDGQLINVDIATQKPVSMPMGDEMKPSQKYTISGDIKTVVSYTKDTNEWIGLSFKVNGAQFIYEPVTTK